MKNYYKILLQFFVVSLFSFASYSQSIISGVVVDGSTNEPLIGANVSIKGTTDGTFTGLYGSFCHLGYILLMYKLKGRNNY